MPDRRELEVIGVITRDKYLGVGAGRVMCFNRERKRTEEAGRRRMFVLGATGACKVELGLEFEE